MMRTCAVIFHIYCTLSHFVRKAQVKPKHAGLTDVQGVMSMP